MFVFLLIFVWWMCENVVFTKNGFSVETVFFGKICILSGECHFHWISRIPIISTSGLFDRVWFSQNHQFLIWITIGILIIFLDFHQNGHTFCEEKCVISSFFMIPGSGSVPKPWILIIWTHFLWKESVSFWLFRSISQVF